MVPVVAVGVAGEHKQCQDKNGDCSVESLPRRWPLVQHATRRGGRLCVFYIMYCANRAPKHKSFSLYDYACPSKLCGYLPMGTEASRESGDSISVGPEPCTVECRTFEQEDWKYSIFSQSVPIVICSSPVIGKRCRDRD